MTVRLFAAVTISLSVVSASFLLLAAVGVVPLAVGIVSSLGVSLVNGIIVNYANIK
jgi:hypothetical protein